MSRGLALGISLAIALGSLFWVAVVVVQLRGHVIDAEIGEALGFFGAMLGSYLLFSAAVELRIVGAPKVSLFCGLGLWGLYTLSLSGGATVGSRAADRAIIATNGVLAATLVLKYLLLKGSPRQFSDHVICTAE